MFSKHTLTALLTLTVTTASAQKMVTNYPNGNRQFEGEYKLAFSAADSRDQYTFDTAGDKRRVMGLNMAARGMERDAAPQKIYNGKCTFYYDNGKVSYTGTYTDGVKNGLFSYAYYNGGKEAEYTFVNGMADGKLTGWYPGGKLRTEQHYTALTDAEMDTMYTHKIAGGMQFMGNSLLKAHNSLRTFANDSVRKMPGNTFTKFAEFEGSLQKNTNWNGDFYTYYENGNKCLEQHYKNNVRTGKWYYRAEDGKVNVELTFEDGKIAGAINKLPADQPVARNSDPAARQAAMDSMRTRMQQDGMLGAGSRATPTVEVNKYIKEHLVYPKAAKQNNVQGTIVVKFMVNEDGSTSDFTVLKSLGSGCDEEAINVIKGMPAWKPAMKDNKPIKSPNTLPVQFNIDAAKK